MKGKLKYAVILVIILIFTGACSNVVKDDKDLSGLEMYLLVFSENGEEFIVQDQPLFTGNDISSYDWETHTIKFTKEFLDKQNIETISEEDEFLYGGSTILKIYYPDRFAFYLDGEELYRGYIKPQAYISFMPFEPTLTNAKNGIKVICINEDYDTRNDEKLKAFLTENNLMR